MSAFELILAIFDFLDNNPKETCEVVTELLEATEGSKFEHDLKIALDEFIDCNCLCPICFSSMELKESHNEPRGEYMGTECHEIVTKWGCSECDYIMD